MAIMSTSDLKLEHPSEILGELSENCLAALALTSGAIPRWQTHAVFTPSIGMSMERTGDVWEHQGDRYKHRQKNL